MDAGDTARAIATSAPPRAEMAAGRVVVAGVDDVHRTQLAGQLELLVLDVDRDDLRPGDPGVLHGQVTQPADAEHRDEVGGPHAGDLDRLVRRDAGAGQRSRVEGGDAVRDGHHVRRRGDGVLGVAAVDRVAGVALALAQRLPP
jgi:hypothetical protein